MAKGACSEVHVGGGGRGGNSIGACSVCLLLSLLLCLRLLVRMLHLRRLLLRLYLMSPMLLIV